MSLDCFPLVRGQSIGLREQPMALDIAYDQNLLITVVDSCQTVIIYELREEDGDRNKIVGTFSLGRGIVINRVAYCAIGDYIACIGHNNGSMVLHAVFGWRSTHDDADETKSNQLRIEELDLSQTTTPIDEVDRRNKLEDIDVCQRTGNLAASYGDLVVIYQYDSKLKRDEEEPQSEVEERQEDALSEHSSEDLDKLNELTRPSRQFNHIISVKLSIWAHSISLVENYLSVSTSDHVQVIKLELLTLQIQSDGQNDNEQLSNFQTTNQTNRSSSGSSGDSRPAANKSRRSSTSTVSRNRHALMGSGGEDMNADSTTTASSGGDTDSMMSDSNNSTTTNFSAFNTTTTTTTATATSATMPAQLAPSECSDGDGEPPDGAQSVDQTNNDSDMSIITMNHQIASLLAPPEEPPGAARSGGSLDDCITWNLNTKKLVKLPTLMHNTSSDLSSFHICHPLELLGPASESIACRVLARLYSADFCQNQLEPVILLCKQFDCDRDPVKSLHLQPVYLSSLDDHKRLSRSVAATESSVPNAEVNQINTCSQTDSLLLLKSQDHELLASVTCFVATLYKCFVYSLHGKKVTRIQTITHPAMCLDLRPDLLNVYVLTTPGLQICSTGLCDSTFRYDWSSSADLNLSFVACDRVRVLATSKYLIMINSLRQDGPSNRVDGASESCFIEVWRKPSLSELFKRVLYINKRCQSISIRSNLLTYLHACAQLSLISIQNDKSIGHQDITGSIELLKSIAIMLCKELLHKKQTNVITNSRIDKVIKHLLDISHCDLRELMSRHIEELNKQVGAISGLVPASNLKTTGFIDERSYSDDDDEAVTDDEQPLDSDYELLTIYLRYAKYQPYILTYLQANASDELICTRILTYMFQHNPRLLIKCAQRFARGNSQFQQHALCVNLLIERLKQLAEFDSTGINRATVLFTLANLYSSSEAQHGLAIQTVSQIKPLSHLAITMCSNHEIIDRPMAELVAQNYPEVYKLFISHLSKRDTNAACEFAKLLGLTHKEDITEQRAAKVGDLGIKNFGAKLKLFNSDGDERAHDSQDHDEDELFDQKLEFLSKTELSELADMFLQQIRTKGNGLEELKFKRDEDETIEAYLRASIGLLESQFILARLCENSR